MGLDWIATNRAKEGHEEEFRQLLARANEGGITDEMHERYGVISIAPYTMVGAPVVGRDALADAFILFRVRTKDLPEDAEPDAPDLNSEEAHTPQNDEEREALAEMAGYHVLELAPPCDGLPIYTHGNFMEQLDLTSFRGKFLHDCEDIIGADLMGRAYEDQTPEELAAYGEQLLEHAHRYAAANNCTELEHSREPPDDLESPAGKAHILFAAGRWCRYWGTRGFGLDAWS